MKEFISKITNEFSIKTFGNSMYPILQNGDVITIKKINPSKIKVNDIICFQRKNKLITHRVIYKANEKLITKGDSNPTSDGQIRTDSIVGRVELLRRNNQEFDIKTLYLLQSSIYFEEMRKVIGKLSKKKIDFVILKGLPLHLYLEKTHPQRIYADCDILINKNQKKEVIKILKKEGY